MAVTVYTSDDTGAPLLFGSGGSFFDVLNQCLVTGYGGVKATASISFSGNPADGDTLTIDSYVYRFKNTMAAAGDIKIGASQAATQGSLAATINGTGVAGTDNFAGTFVHPSVYATSAGGNPLTLLAKVAGTGANSIALAKSSTVITLPGSTMSGGSGSITKVAAGWTMNYAAAQAAGAGNVVGVLKSGSGLTNIGYFLGDYGATATGTTQDAWIAGVENPTALRTYTAKFPTDAQASWMTAGGDNGILLRKSATTTTLQRKWVIIADDRTCYIFVQDGSLASTFTAAAFGEFYSILPTTDSFRALVIGRTSTAAGTVGSSGENLPVVGVSLTTLLAGHYLARDYTATGGSVQVLKWGDAARAAQALAGSLANSGLTFPNPVDGSIHISPVHISEGVLANGVRGRMRGFFYLCHNANNFNAGPALMTGYDTITGSGAYAGRTFVVIRNTLGAAPSGYCIDITGPWETN